MNAHVHCSLPGRALLRMKDYHLERLGVEAEEQHEILQDLLLLRVQEELEDLNDIYSGETSRASLLHMSVFWLMARRGTDTTTRQIHLNSRS